MGIQKLNNKGMQIKLAFFAVIAVSVALIASGVWVSQWNSKYESGIMYDLKGLNKLDEVSGTAGSQQGRLSPNSPDPGSDFETNTYRGAFGIISNIYEPFRIVFGEGGMIDSITDRWGIPNYIRQALVTLIIIAFTFALVAIIFRIPGGKV